MSLKRLTQNLKVSQHYKTKDFIMRKITQQAVNAFNSNSEIKLGNTEIKVINDEQLQRVKVECYLFGNLIAYKCDDNIENTSNLYISSQGYQTSTTRERLNGLLGDSLGRVYISDFYMYYQKSNKTITHLSGTSFTQAI